MVSSMTATRPLRPGLVLGLVAGTQFVLQLDFAIVNVALHTIQRELDFAPATLQWIVTGYALTFGALLLLGGRTADLLGNRRLLLSGLVVFGLASLLAGLAWTGGVLIAARFLQGASAAMVAPSALAMLSDVYEDGPDRQRALAIFQASTAGGATAGIVLGGILTQFVGWRAVFLVNPPIIVLLVVLLLRFAPHRRRTSRTRLDVLGAVLVTVSVAALILGLSEGQQQGFGSGLVLVSLAAFVVLGVVFLIVERRVAQPMLPFAILTDRARRAALASLLLLGALIAAYTYFIALYMQDTLGFTALDTGLALIPATGTVMTTSILVTRRVIRHLGIPWTLVIGLLISSAGQLWLSRIGGQSTYAVNILPGLLLTTFGVGLVLPTASVAITANVAPADRGLAGALLVTAQQIGAAIGLGVLATVAAARTAATGSLVDGYRLSYLLAAALVLAASLIVLTSLRRRTAAEPGRSTRSGRAARGPR